MVEAVKAIFRVDERDEYNTWDTHDFGLIGLKLRLGMTSQKRSGTTQSLGHNTSTSPSEYTGRYIIYFVAAAILQLLPFA